MDSTRIFQPSPWINARLDLAEWAANHLVNRSDARGGYFRDGDGVRRVTRKHTDRRWVRHEVALQRHFSASAPEHIVGLHSTSPENTSRWLAIDIDAHHGEDPIENLRLGISITEKLADFDLSSHIFDSDGRGGLHIWTLFEKPAPTRSVFELGRRVTSGLAVEFFPKQSQIVLGGYGNWIRLPGLHHSRPHWSRYWSESRWLDADSTVQAILAIEPCPIEKLPTTVRIARAPTPPPRRHHRFKNFANSPESLHQWLEDHGVVVKKHKFSVSGSVTLVLGLCPMTPDHGEAKNDSSVAVIWRPLGIGFHCFHQRCAHFGWRDLRAKIDPAYINEVTSIDWNQQPDHPLENGSQSGHTVNPDHRLRVMGLPTRVGRSSAS